MERLISKRASFEPAKGTRDQNIDVLIYFEQPKTLTRAEEHYQQLIRATQTKTRTEVALEFPKDYAIHHSTVEKLLATNIKTRTPWGGNLKSKNSWIGGVAGTGKSKWASGIVEPQEQYPKNGNKWWDGYCSELHKGVIVEGMGPQSMK
jgi:hypothetical protein